MQINLNALAFLAGLYKTDNRLSLLMSAGKGNMAQDPSGDLAGEPARDPVQGEKDLKASGWFDGDVLRDEAKSILEVLAKPQRSGRIAIREGDALIEKIGYRKDESFVLVERTGEGLEVTAPESLHSVVMALSQVTGMSRVIAYDLDMELPTVNALVYLGLVDLYRKTAMLGIWKAATPDVTVSALAAHLADPVPGSLVAMVKGMRDSELSIELDQEALRRSLESMEIVQIVNGGHLRLTGDHARFAMEFLVPRAVTTLEVYNCAEGKIAGSEALVISAGLNEHLLVKFGADQWALSLVSGSYVLKLIENVLNAPQLEF